MDEHVRRTVAVSWRVFFFFLFSGQSEEKRVVFFSPALFFSSRVLASSSIAFSLFLSGETTKLLN